MDVTSDEYWEERRKRLHPSPLNGRKRNLILDLMVSHPISLLEYASGQLATAGPGFNDLMTGLIDEYSHPSCALLSAMLPMLEDRFTIIRVRRELDTRTHLMPEWLSLAEEFRVTQASGERDGGVDTLVVGGRAASGDFVTLVVSSDRGSGDLTGVRLSDAPVGFGLSSAADLSLPEARDALVDVLVRAEKDDPVAVEGWPELRPLMRWFARLLTKGR